jgi:hypothetical protein
MHTQDTYDDNKKEKPVLNFEDREVWKRGLMIVSLVLLVPQADYYQDERLADLNRTCCLESTRKKLDIVLPVLHGLGYVVPYFYRMAERLSMQYIDGLVGVRLNQMSPLAMARFVPDALVCQEFLNQIESIPLPYIAKIIKTGIDHRLSCG